MKILTTILAFVFILLFVSPVHALLYPDDPGFRGCVVKWTDEPGQYDDIDCDKIPDVYDNCPLTPNPEQVDIDKNGLGDFCDLVIDMVRIEPETPMQGRSMVVDVGMFNAREYPMRNLNVKVEVPQLGIADNEPEYLLNSGDRVETEVVLRVPECAPTAFVDVVAIVEYPFAPGQMEVFSQAVKVPIISSGQCPFEAGLDKTIVDILEIQDVDPITGAAYPFSITNTESESKSYILGVQGIENWGWAEILPGSVVIVPPGEVREGVIQVWAFPNAPSGDYSFSFSVDARNDYRQVFLLADVPEPALEPVSSPQQMMLGILVFLVVLVLISLVLIFIRQHHKDNVKKRTKHSHKKSQTK